MDLIKLDSELNIKIIKTLKDILKLKDVKISFDNPHDDILEASNVKYKNHNFKIFIKNRIDEVDDYNKKYIKFFSKRFHNNVKDLNQPQVVNYIKKNTKYLFFLKPFLGKKIIKSKLETHLYRISYNNIIIEINKEEYQRLNYYAKYVYKLQQLHGLNEYLGIKDTYKVVFDDDDMSKNLYNSMYNNLKDILKPPNNRK